MEWNAFGEGIFKTERDARKSTKMSPNRTQDRIQKLDEELVTYRTATWSSGTLIQVLLASMTVLLQRTDYSSTELKLLKLFFFDAPAPFG